MCFNRSIVCIILIIIYTYGVTAGHKIDTSEELDISVQPRISPEVIDIHSSITQHVINQANIPISFHIQNPVTPFIGRSGELSEIKWTHVDHKMAVITGPRGVGKSELARKYAQEFKHDNTSSTIWMDSETHESLIASFKDLAVAVGIKVEGKPVTALIREVVAHFNNRKTLVIFDNAEDDNVLVKNMGGFIGKSKYIFVVVTSRQNDWSQKEFKELPLGVFTTEESKEYLKAMLKKNINMSALDDHCFKLSEILKNLPLALSEAISYITQENSMYPNRIYTINDYIIQFINKLLPVAYLTTTESVISDSEIERDLQVRIAAESLRLVDRVAVVKPFFLLWFEAITGHTVPAFAAKISGIDLEKQKGIIRS